MAHTIFDNKLIENKAESILETKMTASTYMKLDDTLTAQDGRKVDVNTYVVTGELESLAMGEGNTKEFEVSFTTKEYEVETLQGKWKYHDEEAQKDSFAIDQLITGVAEEMVNDMNKKFFVELAKGTKEVTTTTSAGITFENVVDGIALFKENDKAKYLFVNPAQVAKMRKNLKDLLSYSEAFVRTGYIGTVAGVSVVMTNSVPDGAAYIATTEAVTNFVKKGIENEADRDADKRITYNYTRKVNVIALTDAREVVKITLA